MGLGNNRHTAESKHGRLLAHCWACDAGLPALRKKLHELAGDHSAPASARPSAPTPTKAKPVGSPTRYRCLGLNGAQRTHIRRDYSDGTKKMSWDDDSNASSKDLIYDPHPPTREYDASQPVVVVEGEKTADALHARGVSVLGTVCGSGVVPSTDMLRHFINTRLVYLWPDRSHDGQVHMMQIAERLGGDVQIVDPGSPGRSAEREGC